MPCPKKNASIVWKYFQKNANNPGSALCTLCKTSYKRANSTSNLLDHLNRKHITILNRDRMVTQTEESEDDVNAPGTSAACQRQQITSDVFPSTDSTGPPLKRQKQMVLSNR